jgi:prevent-host-death family protein
MKLSSSVKPISYFKAHASEIIRQISGKRETLVITQNGEAKAVVQDIRQYEETQESLALLKILALSSQSMKEGKTRLAKESFQDIREQIKKERVS